MTIFAPETRAFLVLDSRFGESKQWIGSPNSLG